MQTKEERAKKLSERYAQIAADLPWYAGTGNDDPVLDHQWQGACYGAYARRWFLGDEPGAGKTRTSVGWADLVGAEKIVLVAEANVCAQFAGEVMTLAPHRTLINLAGLSAKTRHDHINSLLKREEGVVVINYEMFRRDHTALAKIQMWQADTIIIDEAHNMKDPQSSNARYVRAIAFAQNTCPGCTGLVYGLEDPCPSCGWQVPDGNVKAYNLKTTKSSDMFLESRSVKNLLAMTGTPVLNTPMDLFSIAHLIDPVEFPTKTKFKEDFTRPNYATGKSEFTRGGLERIKNKLKGRYLARNLEDVGIFLPKQHIHVERVELDPVKYPLQHRTITQISDMAKIEMESGEISTIMEMISIILRKRQANVWPGGIEVRDDEGNVTFSVGDEVKESVKMDECLAKIVDYHKKGKRQIVFSQFASALEEFEKRVNAKGIRAVRFDGSTPKPLRDEIKTNFYKAKNEVPKWDVVLVHYRTGGAGLNLTAAEVTHILDEEWNAGKRDQSYARNHRMGQDKETHVHVYRIPNSIDTWMANLIAIKERLATKLGQTMSADRQLSMLKDAIKKGEI